MKDVVTTSTIHGKLVKWQCLLIFCPDSILLLQKYDHFCRLPRALYYKATTKAWKRFVGRRSVLYLEKESVHEAVGRFCLVRNYMHWRHMVRCVKNTIVACDPIPVWSFRDSFLSFSSPTTPSLYHACETLFKLSLILGWKYWEKCNFTALSEIKACEFFGFFVCGANRSC